MSLESMERKVGIPLAIAGAIGLTACSPGGGEAGGESSSSSSSSETSKSLPDCDVHLKVGDQIDIGDAAPVVALTGIKLNKTEGVIRPYFTEKGGKPAVAITSPDGKEIGEVIPLSRVTVLARAAVDKSANYCKLPTSIPKKLQHYVNGVTLTATVRGPMHGAPRPGFIDPPKNKPEWTPGTLAEAIANGTTSQPSSLLEMTQLGYKKVNQG
jgi:hypothetical protein